MLKTAGRFHWRIFDRLYEAHLATKLVVLLQEDGVPEGDRQLDGGPEAAAQRAGALVRHLGAGGPGDHQQGELKSRFYALKGADNRVQEAGMRVDVWACLHGGRRDCNRVTSKAWSAQNRGNFVHVAPCCRC